MTCIIFDTETTGLPNGDAAPLETQPRIIEFAAIKTDKDLKEIARLDFIIDPGHELSDIITKITGLSTSDVKGQPTFAAKYDELAKFFVGAETIIAHNLAFDISMLRFDLMRIGKLTAFPWPPKQICTVEKTFHLEGYRLNLAKLHKKATDVDHIDGAHRAMVDVEALLKCCIWLKNKGLIDV